MKQIKHKPIPQKVLNEIRENGHNALIEITLNTGARLNELLYIINRYNYDEMPDTMEVPVKKSHYLGVFYFNESAKKYLKIVRANFNNQSISRSTLVRRLNGILKPYGDYTNHNLRAYYITNLINRGIDIKTVSVLAHHNSIEMTAAYTYVNEAKLLSSVRSLDDNETYEGMTFSEMRNELFRLRRLITEMENK